MAINNINKNKKEINKNEHNLMKKLSDFQKRFENLTLGITFKEIYTDKIEFHKSIFDIHVFWVFFLFYSYAFIFD